MRLTTEQIKVIKQTVAEVFGDDAEVRLFGSRLNDQIGGGEGNDSIEAGDGNDIVGGGGGDDIVVGCEAWYAGWFIFWLIMFWPLCFIPLLLLFKDGQVQATQVGAVGKGQLTQMIDKAIGAQAA